MCQAAMRLDPKIDKQTIGYCRKLTSDKDDTKKPGEVAAPFVSLVALEMLMDKHGKEVTHPADFVAWAQSNGIDLAYPLLGTIGEAEQVTVAQEQTALTPSYGWVPDSPMPAGAARPSANANPNSTSGTTCGAGNLTRAAGGTACA